MQIRVWHKPQSKYGNRCDIIINNVSLRYLTTCKTLAEQRSQYFQENRIFCYSIFALNSPCSEAKNHKNVNKLFMQHESCYSQQLSSDGKKRNHFAQQIATQCTLCTYISRNMSFYDKIDWLISRNFPFFLFLSFSFECWSILARFKLRSKEKLKNEHEKVTKLVEKMFH